jgi:hypothetical protein
MLMTVVSSNTPTVTSEHHHSLHQPQPQPLCMHRRERGPGLRPRGLLAPAWRGIEGAL